MPIPLKGESEDSILGHLSSLKSNDLDWQGGHVFGYIYDLDQRVMSVIHKAYTMFLTESGLDPTTFPSVMELEKDVVASVRTLLRGGPGVVGNFTSGGTESIICAMKACRDWARANRPEITVPEIIAPRSAHPAFHKAAHYLGMKVVITKFDTTTFRADVEDMRRAITPNTIVLVGSAPGYAQGVVDPIPEIAALAKEKNLLCHVDACVGGIMLSMMRDMDGFNPPNFDFSVPGVTSMSADLHKFGFCAKGASTVFFHNADLRKHMIFACAETTSYALVNNTVLSSKSGGPVAAAWAVLHLLGRDGFERVIRDLMECTHKIIAAINATPGLRVLTMPDMSLFSFVSDDPDINIFLLADALKRHGWYVQPQFSTELSPANLHLTVNPRTISSTDDFIRALPAAVAEVKSSGARIPEAQIKAIVQMLAADTTGQAVKQASAMSGGKDGELPKDFAFINAVMDTAPDRVTESLLVGFLNDMFV